MTRKLAIFDFDYTIVDDNTDTFVRDLLHKDLVPPAIRKLHKKDGWTAYMQGIFKLLHVHGFDETQIRERLKLIPPTAGMIELIQQLAKTGNTDIVLISDSNSFFINAWLAHYNLQKHIFKIFTNPAKFVKGLLKIEMYHLQTSCNLSTKNLCKGRIFEEFVAMRKKGGVIYDEILYAGDGNNDFCPILRLSSCDIACVRKGYKCVDLVEDTLAGRAITLTSQKYEIKAKVLIWNDGFDIINRITDTQFINSFHKG